LGTSIERFGEVADLLLLDGWHATVLGGSGTTFRWDEVGSVRGHGASGLRIGAAGGLTPDNVAEAVRQLAPDLVDVASGVEVRPGVKDPNQVREFVRRALDASRSP
jgi:phosphoribosylanthranilate isomerase